MGGYSTFSQYYDELTQNIPYKTRAEYFDTIIKDNGVNGGILLDLACGTGNLSLPLSKLGYEVIGTDSSADMLMTAQMKAISSGENILFLNQSMQQLDLYGTVDAVVCALDSVNHIIDIKELVKAFERVSLFMHPNGVFIFDINSKYKHFDVIAGNTFVYDCENVYCVWQNTQKDNNIVNIDLDFFEYEDDCYYRTSDSFRERYYSYKEISEILLETGLEIISVYGDDTFNKPDEKTERIIYTVKKGLI